MTDLQTFQAMLTGAGIPFTTGPFLGTPYLPAATSLTVRTNTPIHGLPIDAHLQRKVVFGYSGFYMEFYFTIDGTFVNLGAYE